MTRELAKGYEPHDVEKRWYAEWESKGYFHAAATSDKKPYCIVIPPPNVTGALHMGHALNNTLQDILCRWKRMQGYNVLWMPGTDHAGIATQNVVERQLAAEGKDRHELGREAFIERVWKWKAESGGQIIGQLKRLGASCDWERERFTMDEGLSKAVRTVFVKLYEDGLIYRDNRLINWCPRCHTALSDIEVEHEDKKGHLWHIRYPVVGEPGRFVVVATTRPETMLGDTAVAVHPEDERYQRPDRQEGAPAADQPRDPGGRRRLRGSRSSAPAWSRSPRPTTSTTSRSACATAWTRSTSWTSPASSTPPATSTRGWTVLRRANGSWPSWRKPGLLEKIDDHAMSVGGCYRCKTVVEPYLSLQWYVKVAPLAERALAAVKEGKTRILPKQWENTYYDWMENIRDWCISRQIWWGHRIPAWFCDHCDGVTVSMETPAKCGKCGSDEIRQETDVLDTWFSSALWPFSTLGWPDQTAELKTFYPTACLVTGFDILFFWVARMMMMGLHFMDEVPVHGRLHPRPGARCPGTEDVQVQGERDRPADGHRPVRHRCLPLHPGRLRRPGTRHQAGRGAHRRLPQLLQQGLERGPLHPDEPGRLRSGRHQSRQSWNCRQGDKWILHRLNETARTVDETLDRLPLQRKRHGALPVHLERVLRLVPGTVQAGHLQRHDPERKQTAQYVLWYTLENLLRLLHPFMPFITEEIWQALPGSKSDSDHHAGRLPRPLCRAAPSPRTPPTWSGSWRSSAASASLPRGPLRARGVDPVRLPRGWRRRPAPANVRAARRGPDVAGVSEERRSLRALGNRTRAG